MTDIREAIGVTPEWQERCRKRMAFHDALPPEVRELANEFGSTLITQFLNCGVKNPRHIRHLIMQVGAISAEGNGGMGLVRNRCADLGALVGHMNPAHRPECIAAFLDQAEPSNRRRA